MKGTEILEVIIGCVEEHHTPIFCSHLKKMIEHGRQWTPAICHTHSSHAFKTALKPMSTNNTTASDFKFCLLPFLHIHTHTHTRVHTHTHSLTLTNIHSHTHTKTNSQNEWNWKHSQPAGCLPHSWSHTTQPQHWMTPVSENCYQNKNHNNNTHKYNLQLTHCWQHEKMKESKKGGGGGVGRPDYTQILILNNSYEALFSQQG